MPVNPEALTSATAPADEPGEGLDPTDEARGNVYSLLAALLAAPPGEELLGRLRGVEPPDGEATELGVAWRMLRLAADRAREEAVDDEFHGLFIGISRGELVPYGSWYMTGLLMDKPLALLRRDLAAMGFERQSNVREPEDHIAALCEVLALANRAGSAMPLGVQASFFNDHLAPWVEVFFDDLQNAYAACFYRPVGQLGSAFMRVERQYLNMPV
ncbi:MAG: molecular chaperone TorD family protein [Gammaproteobacteria bacterium]|nr:molecular chaperone TorD family protein [Gammaproteobacteria bacterium]